MPKYSREQPDLLAQRNDLLGNKERLWRKAFKKPTVAQFKQVMRSIDPVREDVRLINRILHVDHDRKVGGGNKGR